MKDLKSLADEAKKTLGSGVVAIANTGADGKGAIVVSVTPDLTERFNAVDFVRLASERLGGKGGGGRPDMAQAGGPDGSQAEAALQAVEDALRERATG
jgi:alanyl-tRNA synthetase